jgi:crooked neck
LIAAADVAQLEEEAGDVARVREVYERAVANLPPANEKRFWQRCTRAWAHSCTDP